MIRKLKYLVCLICCLSLCGCGAGNIAKNIMSKNEAPITEDDPAPVVAETPKTAAPQTSASAPQASAPKADTPAAANQGLPKAIEHSTDKKEEGEILDKIIENATSMSIVAILSDSGSDSFKAFGEAEMDLEVHLDFGEIDTNTILFTPLQDDVRIMIEAIEYRPNLSYSWFDVKETLYDFQAEMGKHYELEVYLAETIPYFRVSAEWGGRKLSWNCQYDGRGDRDITYLSLSEVEEPVFEYEQPYIETLSGAAAVSYALFEEDEFWESVLYAATLIEGDGSSNPIILSKERFFQYIEAIHPGYTMWPSFPEFIDSIVTYSERDETYMFEPYDNDPIGIWELNFIEPNSRGDGGSVWVYVTCGNISEFPVAYEVIWARNKNRGIDDPFAFCIVEIVRHEAVG